MLFLIIVTISLLFFIIIVFWSERSSGARRFDPSGARRFDPPPSCPLVPSALIQTTYFRRCRLLEHVSVSVSVSERVCECTWVGVWSLRLGHATSLVLSSAVSMLGLFCLYSRSLLPLC